MSVYTGESRGELLAWLNDLLAPQQITKLEQCGTGSIYCQVIDSIYGDVPISRVKFNAKHEYEYLDNFKILQKAFKQHQIDKPIPVDKLVKCKMQDNLEFLQWLKKYWDVNSRGEGYDAAGRAGGIIPTAPPQSTSRAAPRPVAHTRAPMGAPPRSVSSASNAQLEMLHGQIAELSAAADGFEKERDFYFEKLRGIEVLVQERNAATDLSPSEQDFIAKVSEILYQTTEGFELPQNGEEQNGLDHEEEETF